MIISAVGAGGKTTLLRKTAERLSLRGETAVLTTTTKIRKPEIPEIRRWEENGGRIRVSGTPVENGKLSSPSEQEFQALFRNYRHVLIEKHFPHHGAVAFSHCGKALFEVMKYLGVKNIGYNRPAGNLYPTENPFA